MNYNKSVDFMSGSVGGCQHLFEMIGNFSCYFQSIMFMAIGAEVPSPGDVVGLWLLATQKGIIHDDGFVVDPVRLYNLACDLKRQPQPHCSQCLKLQNDGTLNLDQYMHSGANVIVCMEYGTYTHFVVARFDEHGAMHLVFDPIGPTNNVKGVAASNTAKAGQVKSFRVFL